MVSWTEYQSRTHETAVYDDVCAWVYVSSGLFGELAELAGCFPLHQPVHVDLIAHRGYDIRSELGDFCWYLSEAANLCGVGLGSCWAAAQRIVLPGMAVSGNTLIAALTKALGHLANDMKKVSRDKTCLPAGDAFPYFAEAMQYIYVLQQASGWPMERILENNLAKLEGRKERGTLQGNGENR